MAADRMVTDLRGAILIVSMPGRTQAMNQTRPG